MAHNLGDDAAAKEKEKKTGDMSRSQNSKKEWINEGDDEIGRLIEERRNTAKGNRHQLRELSNRIKKVHQRQKTEPSDMTTYSGFWRNSEASKMYHA